MDLRSTAQPNRPNNLVCQGGEICWGSRQRRAEHRLIGPNIPVSLTLARTSRTPLIAIKGCNADAAQIRTRPNRGGATLNTEVGARAQNRVARAAGGLST